MSHMIYNSKLFSFNRDTLTFTTEASDLRMDAYPETFGMQSAITGVIKHFVHEETLFNVEQEIIGARYKSWINSVPHYAVILND